MTSVAVHTFVIEPIWKTESGVTVHLRRRAEHARGGVDDLAVLEDGDGRTGHVVLVDERGEAGGDELSDVVE